MRAFMTKDNMYYETENGSLYMTDTEVPLRPSSRHQWNPIESKWVGSREGDDDDLARMRLRVKDVLTLGSVLVSLVGMYYGLTSKIELQGERFTTAIQNLRDMEVMQTNAVNTQIEDIKHRLEIHEERTTKP
jgi:hypothetical protein